MFISQILAVFTIVAGPGDNLAEVRDRARARPGAEVVLKGGTYRLKDTLKFTAADSGVVWRAEDGARVEIAGGVELPASAFHNWSGREGVMVAELAAYPVEYWKDQQREFRMPLPVPELFVDGRRMTVAAWPNGGGFAEVAEIVDGGTRVSDGTPFNKLTPPPVRRGPVFLTAEERPLAWRDPGSTWLHGYWCYDWSDSVIPGAAISRETNGMTKVALAKPHCYGMSGGAHKTARRWRAVHLLEELDAPGEYFVDRTEKKLYFMPESPLVPASRIVLTFTERPLFELQAVSNAVFRGLVFTEGFGMGVKAKNCNGVTFEQCRFRNLRTVAADFSGCSACKVSGCEVTDTGAGGIVMVGGDRRTLTRGENVIEHSVFRRFSTLRPMYTPGVTVGGCGNTVRYCEFTDTPQMAVTLTGNDQVFEHCVVSNACMCSDDAAAFYKGRDPSCTGNVIRHCLFSDIGSVRRHGNAAIYFDDGDCGERVEHCTFRRVRSPARSGFGAVFCHGGYSNVVSNCVFEDCERPLGYSKWNQKRWLEFIGGVTYPYTMTRLKKNVDVESPLFQERYPFLRGFMAGAPETNRCNVAVNCEFRNCRQPPKGHWELIGCRSQTDSVRPLEVKGAPFPLTISVWEVPEREFSITDFGAKPTGEPVTEAIDRAIAACVAAGGGRVRFPAGRWVSGAFDLKSNVALALDDGACLHFTDDPVKCMRAPLKPDGRPQLTHRGLISAHGCTNIAIVGRGTISCDAGYWHRNFLRNPQRGFPRPMFFRIDRSKNIRFEGFRIRNSPAWTLAFELCEDIVLRDLDSVGTGPNTDGLDFTSCNRALVERCSLDQTDDSYTIKSGSGASARKRAIPTQNVVIRNCRAVHAHALLAIGSEVSGGIRNIYMTGCEVTEECWRWLYMKTNSRRGAYVENVTLENCRGRRATQGICEIEMFYDGNPNKELGKTYKESFPTRIDGIHVRNLVCGEANWAVKVRGDTNLPPVNITAENIRVGRIKSSLVKVSGATDVKVKDVTLDPFAVYDPARLAAYAQTFEAEFADEDAARAAEVAFATLPDGARLAFSTRWDDTTPAHREKSLMLERAGVKGNFYFVGGGDRARLVVLGRELVSHGHAVGNHTLDHPFMLNLSANEAHRQILANRVLLETALGRTVNSYASPYGWYGREVFRDSYRRHLARLLVETGHWVSADNPVDKISLAADTWMPSHRFAANDRQPDEKLFFNGLKRETALALKDPASPRVTLGTHSWCDAAGNALQEKWLKENCVREDWVQLNDLEYGAYRYSAVFGAVRKTRTEGKRAFFEVRRFDPAALGDAIALSLVFSNAAPVAVTSAGKALAAGKRGTWKLPHAEGRAVAKAIGLVGKDGRSAAVPGVAFTAVPDDEKGVFRVTVANEGKAALKSVHVTAHLAPAHFTRVQAFDITTLAPGAKVVRELDYGVGSYANGCADYGFGERYYAASLDFTREGARERVWAEATASEREKKPVTPADAARYAGPVALAAADDAKLAAFTAGVGPLPDVGAEWKPSGYPGAVWYAVGGKTYRRSPEEIKAAEGAVELYAVQFEARERDAVKMRVSSTIGDKKTCDCFLNGKKLHLRDQTHSLETKPGLNRLVIRTAARKEGYANPAFLALYTWTWGSPVECIPFK